MTIEYSQKAVEDLEQIIEYIARDGVRRTLSFADFLKT